MSQSGSEGVDSTQVSSGYHDQGGVSGSQSSDGREESSGSEIRSLINALPQKVDISSSELLQPYQHVRHGTFHPRMRLGTDLQLKFICRRKIGDRFLEARDSDQIAGPKCAVCFVQAGHV